MFNKTFFHFFFGFVAIITIAFGVFMAARIWPSYVPAVDNVAVPQ